MIRFIFLFIALIILNDIKAQLSNEAWINYEESKFTPLPNFKDKDVIIIYDRTYYETVATEEGQTHQLITIHRKVKINSLYGLKQYNKLFIPIFKDLNYAVELITCKVKTLKNHQPSVITDTSLFVSTTLPANTPFYYKKKGNVKMLAINGINIGDEIEYIYTIKLLYNYTPLTFYKTEKIRFSNDNYCLEKSCFFDPSIFEIKLWPINFTNGITRKSNFDYKNGKKISLTNITENTDHYYVNDDLDQPYLLCEISKTTTSNNENTWENFTNNFKPKRRETKHNYIFDNEKIINTIRYIGKIKGKENKFKYLLKQINKPLEVNSLYSDVENDIDIAWNYAKIISKTLKSMHLPVAFSFVISKKYGVFDKSFVSLYQFDNIIISFFDENNIQHFMPLLEPYSNLDEIKPEFQGTRCFTITQNEMGKRSFSFNTIPVSEEKNLQKKNIEVTINKQPNDSIYFEINEQLIYHGNAWLNIKPFIYSIITDSINTDANLKSIINHQLGYEEKIDSIYNIFYSLDSSSFNLSYNYSFNIRSTQILTTQTNMFLNKDFYTPYYLRHKRSFPGYLFDESNVKYTITFNLNNDYIWLENLSLKDEYENNIGIIKMDYQYTNFNLNVTYLLEYKKDRFKKEEWGEMLKIRDLSYDFFNTNLYFKEK